jgi:hypothetical protein
MVANSAPAAACCHPWLRGRFSPFVLEVAFLVAAIAASRFHIVKTMRLQAMPAFTRRSLAVLAGTPFAWEVARHFSGYSLDFQGWTVTDAK